MIYKYINNYFIFLIFIICITLIIFIINLILIYPWKPEQVVYGDRLKKADLIVVLDGEYYPRIDYAFKLVEEGYSDMIFYPSLGYKQTRERIEERLPDFNGKLNFHEGEGASSTFEEALLTRIFIKNNNINSLLLVTSPYHSYRAYRTFTNIIPEAEIISAPVPFKDNWFKLNNIEKNEEALRVIRSEQYKFIAYYLMYWR
jgi:uncharacterized SAM-binding protein YcdF (DUF218 family)